MVEAHFKEEVDSKTVVVDDDNEAEMKKLKARINANQPGDEDNKNDEKEISMHSLRLLVKKNN